MSEEEANKSTLTLIQGKNGGEVNKGFVKDDVYDKNGLDSKAVNVNEPKPLNTHYASSPNKSSSVLKMKDKYGQWKKYVGRAPSGSSFTSVDSTARWNEDFSHRPSWCDASMALKQIKRGKARGSKPALYLRSGLQWILFRLGCLVQRYYGEVILGGLILMVLFAVGLHKVKIQTDIVKLWVEQGGRLDEELHFLSNVKKETDRIIQEGDRNSRGLAPDGSSDKQAEQGLSGGFQVLIQTPRTGLPNILNKKDLLLHSQVLTEISTLPLEMYGENWTLSDLCFKPPAPSIGGALEGVVNPLLDKIIPCVMISPMDCFWDGSKPLGPHPPIHVGEDMTILIPSLPVGDVTWKNLDPTKVLNEVSELFPLGSVTNLFERAGIGAAYQDRICIDPMDPECPKTAPNYFDICNATLKFLRWNHNKTNKIDLNMYVDGDGSMALPMYNYSEEAKPKKEEPKTKTGDDYYDYYGGPLSFGDPSSSDITEKDKQDCKTFSPSVRNLINARPEVMERFLNKTERPKYPNYGEELTNGCKGFAGGILNWPEEMIVGGVKRAGAHISTAESLQSVMMVAGASDIYARFKGNPISKPSLSKSGSVWTSGMAGRILTTWQRRFTSSIYNHTNNTNDGNRQLHPLASTSVGDMLEEFSKFKPKIIIVGYFFMLIYAGLSLCSCKERGVQSCTGLGIAGVVLVTFASAAGLGLSTIIGIDFNAATTQIVPFLTLGLGVDDMFLLVHNYKEIVVLCDKNELGYLLKETGLSVLLTSINNILAFLTGGMLPVPALRSFCIQTAILLFFNMCAILTVFPGLMALDLKRRKSKRVDILCCIPVNTDKIKPTLNGSTKKDHNANGVVHNGPSYEEIVGEDGKAVTKSPQQVFKEGGGCREILGIQHWTLHHFVQHIYIPFLKPLPVKLCVLLLALVLMGFGIVGLTRVQAGLELTDVIPRGTAPYAFLEARDKYFSFYPMFAVIKGPIEFNKKQEQIRNYREAIGKSSFVVTNQGKLGEAYWLSMMIDWVVTMQSALDDGFSKKHVRLNGSNYPSFTPQTTDEAKIAVKLICSVGDKQDCGRLGNVKLIENGIINEEGFYNYLTAWYNLDSMMYYVAQASFYPAPPSWDFDGMDRTEPVPAAEPLKYSQIPFFLNGLVDTPKTMAMITEIREICDKYTAQGLPNFPKGIPFTFWEQYLHLVKNLCVALSIITFAVFVVITILLLSPWTAAMIVSVLVMMVVELAGFMGLVGLKLNPVSAVSLITAVGIGVEFTVHVSLSFLTTMGTREDRMKKTLEHMFIPVLHGGLSTLLGIIMLAFSEFEFIVRYFFTVMAALILLGLINGLMVLPVLLSLVGPNPEVQATDGSHTIPPPTPPLHRKSSMSDNSTSEMNNLPASQNGGASKNGTGGPLRRNDSLSTIEEEGLSPPTSVTPNTQPPAYVPSTNGRSRSTSGEGDKVHVQVHDPHTTESNII